MSTKSQVMPIGISQSSACGRIQPRLCLYYNSRWCETPYKLDSISYHWILPIVGNLNKSKKSKKKELLLVTQVTGSRALSSSVTLPTVEDCCKQRLWSTDNRCTGSLLFAMNRTGTALTLMFQARNACLIQDFIFYKISYAPLRQENVQQPSNLTKNIH